jgi:hypothetical protein
VANTWLFRYSIDEEQVGVFGTLLDNGSEMEMVLRSKDRSAQRTKGKLATQKVL